MRTTTPSGHSAWKGNLPVASLYTAGLAGQEFLAALKDKGEILGSRCAKCSQVYVPAALFCERCFAELAERVPVGPEGEVVTFTVCHVDLDGNRLAKPEVAAAVRLDGATTTLVHRGLGDIARWKIGARARATLAKDRKGSILDLSGFEIV